MTTDVANAIQQRYLSRTPRSRENSAKTAEYLPGGDTRTSTFFGPYPTYMDRGDGCFLYDIDGNKYVDCLNNYTTLIHGHNHPAIYEATMDQLAKGTAFASAATVQRELAEMICDRVPSIELLRFTNSGTEATMMAMRAARAFTGKDVIIKMDGGYHGTHDFVEVNVIPSADPIAVPEPRLAGPGIPACVMDSIMIARFNDLEMVEGMLQEHGDKIAAVIMEPVLGAGGGIPPKPGYLQGMRDLTEKYGVLLIFDEIISFRLSLGGMQRLEGVTPDLTCLGKIIGGGLAIGAFGGRRDIMERFTPGHPKMIIHAGTFNGHNVTMAAGIATLQLYDQAAVDRVGALGSRLRDGVNQAFKKVGIKGQALGFGSLVMAHWTDGQIATPADVLQSVAAAKDLPRLLHLEMLNNGVFSAPRGMYATSTPMTETEIDQVVEAFEATLEVLKPHAAEAAPHLIAE